MPDAGDLVRASGGVVWRTNDDRIEVLLIHRGRYDDWSWPKGKLDAGESDEAAAVRELEEETGIRVRLGDELPSTSYVDRHGRSKTVRYWLMDVEATGPWEPDDEVDALAWCTVDEARRRLSYERDIAVLDAAAEALSGEVATD